MSTVAVVVVVVIIVAGVIAYFAWAYGRRRGVRQRFGPEYDRAVQSHESTKGAEQELLARKKRHDGLDIQPLDPASRERHRTAWRQVQERFVDTPATAVAEADRLLTAVMGERGYPAEGYEQRAADLSVEHAAAVGRYREAHAISTRAANEQASTEELRQAMVHYRTMFEELLENGDEEHAATRNGPATPADASAGRRVVAGTGHAVGTEPVEVGATDARTETERAAQHTIGEDER
jgi:hypothetical protein